MEFYGLRSTCVVLYYNCKVDTMKPKPIFTACTVAQFEELPATRNVVRKYNDVKIHGKMVAIKRGGECSARECKTEGEAKILFWKLVYS